MNNEEGEKEKIITWRKIDKIDNDNKSLYVNSNKKLKETKIYTLKEKEYINKYMTITKNILNEDKLYNIILKYNYNEQLILSEIFYLLNGEEEIDKEDPSSWNVKKNKQKFIPYKTKCGTLKTIYSLKKENKPIKKVLSKDKIIYKYENHKIINHTHNDNTIGTNDKNINENNFDDDNSDKLNKNEFYPKRFSNFNKIIEDYKNKKNKDENNNYNNNNYYNKKKE